MNTEDSMQAARDSFHALALHESLLKAVAKMGFEKTTPVQAMTIPQALEGKDLLVRAATGSGKTMAFLLPTLQHLLATAVRAPGTRALVLVPTRELARQIVKECEKLAAFSSLRVEALTGGQEFKYQAALLRKDPDILVATPGRLLEHVEKSTTDFASLEVLVLDEADRMFEMGMVEDVKAITATCNSARQTMLFSATLPGNIHRLAAELLRDPERIEADPARELPAQIHQQRILADDDKHKDRLLDWLLKNEAYDKAIVFANTRANVDRLCGRLRYHGVRVVGLHGEMRQDDRNAIMQDFRSGKFTVLVATDLAARGLDVKGIDLVINYDMARKGDEYLHRIGRTGRAGELGTSIVLIAASEWNLMASIERYLHTSFEPRSIKALAGSFKGPAKLKGSGKAAGPKKKKSDGKKSTPNKSEARKAQKKAPVGGGKVVKTGGVDAGFAPLKRKKPVISPANDHFGDED